MKSDCLFLASGAIVSRSAAQDNSLDSRFTFIAFFTGSAIHFKQILKFAAVAETIEVVIDRTAAIIYCFIQYFDNRFVEFF